MYVYKLIPASSPPPDLIPDELPLSDLDQRSGFIHLSTAPQVAGTLKHFFTDEPRVYVLRIVYENVEHNIRWEDPNAQICGHREGEGMFPHLYNGKLGKEEVESVIVLEPVDGNWDDALRKAETWLV